MSGQNWFDSVWGIGTDFVFSVEIGIYLVFCGGRKWLDFSVWIETNSVFLKSIKIDLILEWGSKLTWFQWWDQKLLGFCVGDRNWLGVSLGFEIDFLVRGVEIDFVMFGPIIVWCHVWIDIDLVLARESRLTCFFCAGRKWLVFMWRWIAFFCVWVIEIDLFLYARRKSLDFSVSIELDFVFVWVAKVDLISIWGIELDLISV